MKPYSIPPFPALAASFAIALSLALAAPAQADRLNLSANERYDAVHNTETWEHIESALSVIGRILGYSSGVVSGMSASYDSGTQTFDIASGIALDPDGNYVEVPTAGVTTSAVAGADIGTTPLYVWCAVQKGITPTTSRNRVRWNGGTWQTFTTNTVLEDSIACAVSDTQPANTPSGTSYFKTHEILGWNGGTPNTPTTTEIYNLFAYMRADFNATIAPFGSFQQELERMADAMAIIAGASFDFSSPSAVGTTIEEQGTITTDHETRIGLLEGFVTGQQARMVSLTSGEPWRYSGLDDLWAIRLDADEYYWEDGLQGETGVVFGLTSNDLDRLDRCYVYVTPGDDCDIEGSLFPVMEVDGSFGAVLGTDTSAAGGGLDLLDIDGDDATQSAQQLVLKVGNAASCTNTVPAKIRHVRCVWDLEGP